MVSVGEWTKHFQSMAHKAFLHEDMYIVNKGSRGLGRNAFARTTYKIWKSTVHYSFPILKRSDSTWSV